LKSFKDYILHSKKISYVPNNAIKDIITQPNSKGRRGKWISKMQEFDLEIIPTKLVKGQGMDKIMVESNYQDIDLNVMTTNLREL
jgi:hypothetical protein